MIYKVNTMFWNENNNTGYRHVSVENEDRTLMAVAAHNVSGVWESRITPMGFSFNHDEVQKLQTLFSVLPSVMEFLCTEELTLEEIQNFLLTLPE